MGEDRTEGAQRRPDYLTVGEAAKILGVHRNTIHHRIKTGRIKAHKVVEADREVYRIERDSLGIGRTSADVRTLDAQRTDAGEVLARMIATRLDEIVRDYTHELGEVREELGAERARRQMAEERAASLEVELEALREAPGTPQASEEAPEGSEPRPATGGAQEAAQGAKPRPWWRRVFGG